MIRGAARHWWLVTACLLGLAGQVRAQSDAASTQADASELAEAEMLLEFDDTSSAAAVDDAAGKEDPRPDRRFGYGLSSSLALNATGGAPRTELALNESDGSYELGALLSPAKAQRYPSLSLSADLEWEPVTWLLLRTLLDTQEIRRGDTLVPPLEGYTMGGQPVRDAVREGNYIRELSATATLSAFSLELGRFRTRIADGLVHDGFASGLRARLELGKASRTDLRLELVLGSAGPRVGNLQANTLGALSADLHITPFESIGMFLATSRDRSGELSTVLRSALAEGVATQTRSDAFSGRLGPVESLIVDRLVTGVLYPCTFDEDAALSAPGDGATTALRCDGTPDSEGEIGYLGVRFHVLPVAGMSLRGTLALAGGNFDIGIARPPSLDAPQDASAVADEVSFELSGWAGDVEAHYGLHERLDLGMYAFLLSGDDPPTGDQDRYRAFVGLAPYWVWTTVFFSGWINQGLEPSRASAAGINGRGAAGLGSGLEYSHDDGGAQLRAFWLRALAPPPQTPNAGQGLGYGLEIDLSVHYDASAFLRLGLEGGLLFPGDFFAHDDVAYRTLATVTMHYAR